MIAEKLAGSQRKIGSASHAPQGLHHGAGAHQRRCGAHGQGQPCWWQDGKNRLSAVLPRDEFERLVSLGVIRNDPVP